MRLKSMSEFYESLAKEEFFKIIYEDQRINDFYNRSDSLFIKLSDLNSILVDDYDYTYMGLCYILSNSSKYYIRLLRYDELNYNEYYAEINIKNIKVFIFNNHLYTVEKITTQNIIDINNMKSLQDYIEQEKLYETLGHTLNTKTFIDKLTEIFDFDKNNIEKTNLKAPSKTQISVNLKHELTEIDKSDIESFGNLCGYRVNFSGNRILFDPYHNDNANKIVKKYNNIVYHLTTKYFYDKIKDKEYIPYRSEFGYDDKSRLYCFAGKDKHKLQSAICSFKRMSECVREIHNKKFPEYYEKNCLLKIDINKCKDHPIFYYDSAYKSDVYPIFTKDLIPVDSIIKTYEVTDFSIKDF